MDQKSIKNASPEYNYSSQPGPAPYYYDNQGHPQYYPPNQGSAPYYQVIHMVVTQPATNVTQVVSVQDNMGLAIFACLCCFWPLGIVAILRASESRDAMNRGDLNGARVSASDARKFSLISICIGVVLILIAIIVPIIVVTTSASYTYSRTTYYG
ncbi:unnamed protein product [Candidula unifasciata]|uniref:Uncharacterized protein n=1 Tax=Candidula unifasciata TaxID=100452 RepID=A0A8S3YDB1_9EUPU|nr:unnamed protein product [Candidula unifasciata]